MKFKYNRLKGKIIEKCLTQRDFAKVAQISYTSLNRKLNNHCEFTQSEIIKSCDVLGIPYTQISEFFFTIEVQKNE